MSSRDTLFTAQIVRKKALNKRSIFNININCCAFTFILVDSNFKHTNRPGGFNTNKLNFELSCDPGLSVSYLDV